MARHVVAECARFDAEVKERIKSESRALRKDVEAVVEEARKRRGSFSMESPPTKTRRRLEGSHEEAEALTSASSPGILQPWTRLQRIQTHFCGSCG